MNATHMSEPILQIPNDPSAVGTPVRCHHRWPSGRRCRQASEHGNSSFCSTHAAVEQNRHNGDRLYDLLQSDNNLLTAREINKSLASLYFLLAADKISSRRAAVLAYISSLLLRTLPAVEKEESPDGTQIILDLPRPAASDPINLAPDAATTPACPEERRVAQVYAEPRSTFRPVDVTPAARTNIGVTANTPAPPPQKIGPTTPPPPNPPSPQSSTVYHDPNYDDHWFPTAHVIKTLDEIERKRFGPNPGPPHQDAKPDARKPACAGRPAA